MDYERVSAVIDNLRDELRRVLAQMDALKTQQDAIEDAIEDLRRVQKLVGPSLSDAAPSKSTKRGGRGTVGIREAITDALKTAAEPLTDREILDALTLVDKAPKSEDQVSALRTTLGRMMKDGAIKKVRPGVYTLTDSLSAPSDANGHGHSETATLASTATWSGVTEGH